MRKKECEANKLEAAILRSSKISSSLPPSLSFPFCRPSAARGLFRPLSLSLALQGQGFLLPLVSRSNALRPETPPETERDGEGRKEGRKDMGFIMEVGKTQESEIEIKVVLLFYFLFL